MFKLILLSFESFENSILLSWRQCSNAYEQMCSIELGIIICRMSQTMKTSKS